MNVYFNIYFTVVNTFMLLYCSKVYNTVVDPDSWGKSLDTWLAVQTFNQVISAFNE